MSWKRLESGTVAADLAEGLEARMADPLWMLARQWQTGEFKGDDAANPLLLKIEARSVWLERLVLPGGKRIDLTGSDAPLEPLVERETVRGGPAAPWIAVELGRLLIRALRRVKAPQKFLETLMQSFAVGLPPDDGLDPLGRRRLELLARTTVDGARLAAALERTPTLIEDMLDQVGVAERTQERINRTVAAWQRGVAQLFSEPDVFTTWDEERMEYAFSLEGSTHDGESVRLDTGDGYAGGRLDWYSFNRVASDAEGEKATRSTVRRAEVLPAPLRFRGMPASRFWEFEEGDVYLGGIEAAPEDLARVAVAAYGIVYGDDWMVVPIRLKHGTLTQITRVRVYDDFGGVSNIQAAAVVDGGDDGRAFKFFELTGDPNPGNGKAPLLFLPPTVETSDAGRPLEQVGFLRDEMANVAWAVEQRIESAAGRPVDVAARRGAAPAEPSAGDAGDEWDFRLSTPIPEHWVPLVPVRVVDTPGASEGTIMFQRGRAPVAGDPGATRGALGRILVPRQRLLIHEEEIPRAGIVVVRRYQSARDAKGGLHTWVGRRKGPGRGEGDSGLVFDDLDRSPNSGEDR